MLHWWNDNGDGELIDAARARRIASGYLGAQLSSAEVAEWQEAIDAEASWGGDRRFVADCSPDAAGA